MDRVEHSAILQNYGKLYDINNCIEDRALPVQDWCHSAAFSAFIPLKEIFDALKRKGNWS